MYQSISFRLLPKKPLWVKKLLLKGIIFLTSEKFVIFVGAMAVLLAWWGVCTDNNLSIAYGAITWLASITLWAWRQTARDLKRHKKVEL